MGLPRKHLSTDKRLASIIAQQEVYILKKRKNIALQLCFSIMSQQLSTRVAAVFHQRFLGLFNSPSPSATQIASIPFQSLRSIGLSNAKAGYIKNVADFFVFHKLTDRQLHKMENEELIALLTQIKGVGKWTVEMILMFSMQREDIFSVDDLGIRQAVCALYKIDDPGNKKRVTEKILKTAEKWKPFRTYACLYLWGWKDLPPKPLKKA